MKILVAKKVGKSTVQEEIDASTIDYIKPELHACTIFFVDGTSILVRNDEKEITRLIRESIGRDGFHKE